MKMLIASSLIALNLSSLTCEVTTQLPKDVFLHTLSFLPLEDLAHAAKVCKAWYAATKDIVQKLKEADATILTSAENEQSPSLFVINALRLFLHNNNFCIPSDIVYEEQVFNLNVDSMISLKHFNNNEIDQWRAKKTNEFRAIKILTQLDTTPPEIRKIQDEMRDIIEKCKVSGISPLEQRRSKRIARSLEEIFGIEVTPENQNQLSQSFCPPQFLPPQFCNKLLE